MTDLRDGWRRGAGPLVLYHHDDGFVYESQFHGEWCSWPNGAIRCLRHSTLPSAQRRVEDFGAQQKGLEG